MNEPADLLLLEIRVRAASVSLIRISFYSTTPTPLTAYGLSAPDCFGHIPTSARRSASAT